MKMKQDTILKEHENLYEGAPFGIVCRVRVVAFEAVNHGAKTFQRHNNNANMQMNS